MLRCLPRLRPTEAADDLGNASVAKSTTRSGSRFEALSYRNYRLFFFGQLISVTGTWMQSLAQSYLVYELLHSTPFQLGLVNAFQFAPVLLLGIPAGVIADRFPKRTILVITQSIFSLLALILTLLVALGHIQLWQVYLIASIFGVANALDMPTRQAFVPEMVGKSALMNAIALNSTMFNTGRVLGPAIAGIVLAAFGPAICFGANAVSYLGVIGGLMLMRVEARQREAHASPLARLREGVAYVRATPEISRTIVLVGAMGTFGLNFNIWIPMLASDSFGSGAGTYGLLFTAMGIGSLTGALSLALFVKNPSRPRMLLATAALGLAEISLGIAAAIPLAVVVGAILLGIAGFASSNAMAMANTLVQTAADDALRGRVMAVYMTVFAGSAPFGALISGGIANRFGVGVAVWTGGAVIFAAAFGLAWMQRSLLRPPRIASAPTS